MSPSRSQFAIRKWMTLVAACAVILTLVRSPALAGVMTILMLFSPFLVECYKGVQRLRKSSRGSNQNLDFGGYAWQLVNLGILVSLWLGLSGLLVVARGKPEAFLVTTFGRFSRDDAFDNLDDVTLGFWWAHSCLVLIVILATWCRRTDILFVLMSGPIIALAITAVFGEKWTDPNWFQIVAVCEICWLVSTVVGQAYWVLKP
jgi:hypothetical protein